MLIILLFFALVRTLYGIPLSSPADAANGFPVLDLRDTQSHFGERATSNIVLSCFATIFACTWTAVHPNIPALTDCWWTRFKRQFVTMVYALLVPEAITTWALKQRLAAGKIVEDYNNAILGKRTHEEKPLLDRIFKDSLPPPALKDGDALPWTLTHGFFLQMGGFMLSKGGQPIQTIFAENPRFSGENMVVMEQIIEAGIIDRPLITAEDIEDRSKGDAISKMLIIFQTTWFIAQCVARWSSHLLVTELEVITLGFAMLNGITYFLWWNKPQNVGRPVFLEIKSLEPLIGGPLEFSLTDLRLRVAGTENKDTEEPLVNLKKSYLQRKFPQGPLGLRKVLYRMPLHFLGALIRPLGKLSDMEGLDIDMKPGDQRVPMFYSGDITKLSRLPLGWGISLHHVNVTIGGIALLFGSVHLISSWFLHFASVQEKLLWQVSAIIITTVPMQINPSTIESTKRTAVGRQLKFLLRIEIFARGLLACLYIIARIILLTLSFTSLRSLPPAAFQTINWTTFIPHI